MSLWKSKLNKLNNCLERNNLIRLNILTDNKGYVIYLDRFKQVAHLLLDICDEKDILELYNNIKIIDNYFKIVRKKNIRDIRTAIINDLVKSIPIRLNLINV